MQNYFTKEELSCKCGCGGTVREDFHIFLNLIRGTAGVPMVISSGFRCKAYDLSIGGAGVHPTGKAADVLCSGVAAHKILSAALAHGARGVGVMQKGKDHSKRFLHLDLTEGKTRPWIWSY